MITHDLFCLFSPLVHGNCGLVVYVIRHEGREDVLYPLGMFVGEAKLKPSSGENIYQAVLLSPCVEHIKESYPEVVNLAGLTESSETDDKDGYSNLSPTHDSGFLSSESRGN